MRITVLIVVCLFSQQALACSCVKMNLQEYATNADMIFIGRLVKAELVNIDKTKVAEVHYEVVENFKGKSSKAYKLRTPWLEGTCGIGTDIGHFYRIFYKKNKNRFVGLCGGSNQIWIHDIEKTSKKIKAALKTAHNKQSQPTQ
ncbi:MAG: hypothetical protein ACJAS9_000985 [Polaribacter sp.]|jgi:hypothetical protein